MPDNVLNYLIKATWEGGSATQKAKGDIKGVGDTSVTARNGLLELQAGLNIAKEAFGVAGQVVEQFYGALKEGADLEVQRSKFDALAGSIGTVGDALLDDLGAATGGMVSNAALVRGATDLMNLGLVSTAEETVRWSKAVSTLNLDMQVLGLTLANDSTMRLDSLGLSLEVVNEKTDKFIAQGYEASKAFDMAVLEGLEDKMKLFGDASETTAGKLLIIENKWTNLTDKIKLSLAEAWIPWIDIVSGATTSTIEDIIEGNIAQAESIDDLVNQYGRIQDQLKRAGGAAALFTGTQDDLYRSAEQVRAAILDTAAGADEYIDALRRMGIVGNNMGQMTAETARALYDQEKALRLAEQALADMGAEASSADRIMIGNVETIASLAQTVADMGYVQEEAYAGMVNSTAVLEAHRAQVAIARDEYNLTVGVMQSFATTISDGYGAAALAAEDSQARQITANAAISESYRQTSLDVFSARLAETIQEDGLGAANAMIAYQQALGLITPEEAAKLEEVALKTEAITTATGALFDAYMSDGVLTREEMDLMAAAVTSIDEGTSLMSQTIIETADADIPKIVGLHQETATFDEKLGNAGASAGILKDTLAALPTRLDVDIYVNTHGNVPDIGGGTGNAPTPRAVGGPVSAGGTYLVGERGPELFVPQNSGKIIPNNQSGGITINVTVNGGGANGYTVGRQVATAVSEQLGRLG